MQQTKPQSNNALQYYAVMYSTIYGLVKYSIMVLWHAAYYSTAEYSILQYSILHHISLQDSTIQHRAMQYNEV